MSDQEWFYGLTTDEAKEERATLAQRVIAILGVICALVLVGLATNANAEITTAQHAEITVVGLATNANAQLAPLHVYEDSDVKLQLYAAPCDNDKARDALEGSPAKGLGDKLQKATSTWMMRGVTPLGVIEIPEDFPGCWVEFEWQGKKGYAVGFSDGESRFFLKEGFEKAKGQTGV